MEIPTEIPTRLRAEITWAATRNDYCWSNTAEEGEAVLKYELVGYY